MIGDASSKVVIPTTKENSLNHQANSSHWWHYYKFVKPSTSNASEFWTYLDAISLCTNEATGSTVVTNYEDLVFHPGIYFQHSATRIALLSNIPRFNAK